jgi:hypothetical protein
MREDVVQKLKRFLFLRIVGKPTTVQEIRMTFYRVIVMDMFWIDGDLPHDLDQKFDFVANALWEPFESTGLKHMSEELLTHVCTNLKRPAWVDTPNVVKINMSLNEVVKQWPMLFDLTNTKPS